MRSEPHRVVRGCRNAESDRVQELGVSNVVFVTVYM